MPTMEAAPVAPSELSAGSSEEDKLTAAIIAYAEEIRATHPSDEAVFERIVEDIDAGRVPPIVGTLALQLMGI